MSTTRRLQCLTITLGVCAALQGASGQLTKARRVLSAKPPAPSTVGTVVTLSVTGAAPGKSYRYVASSAPVLSVDRAIRTRCSVTQTIGSGVSVPWQPKSGTHRLTAYGPVGETERDTLSLTYEVQPRSVMLNLAQTQTATGSNFTFRTEDLGPGHTYMWVANIQFKALHTGAGASPPKPPVSWSTQTTGPLATYPSPLPPPQSIIASVSAHRGDPCDVIAAGTMQRSY